MLGWLIFQLEKRKKDGLRSAQRSWLFWYVSFSVSLVREGTTSYISVHLTVSSTLYVIEWYSKWKKLLDGFWLCLANGRGLLTWPLLNSGWESRPGLLAHITLCKLPLQIRKLDPQVLESRKRCGLTQFCRLHLNDYYGLLYLFFQLCKSLEIPEP